MSSTGYHRQRSSKHHRVCIGKGTYHHPETVKLSRRTRMRIRYYELKIQISDLWERLAKSIHSTLFNNMDPPVNSKGNSRNKIYSRRRSKIKSIRSSSSLSPRRDGSYITRCKKFHSDREGIRSTRRTITNRSRSLERFYNSRKTHRNEKTLMDCKASKESIRKQRSSRTKRKSSVSASNDDFHLSCDCNNKKSMQSMGRSNRKVHRRSEKSSSTSMVRSDRKYRSSHENIVRKGKNYRKTSRSSTEVCPSSSAPDVDSSDKEELKPNKDLEDEKIKNENEDATTTNATKDMPPPIIPQHHQFANRYPGRIQQGDAVNDTKGLWKRFGSFIVKPRRRQKDIDNLPPKLCKIGIQLNPPGEKIRENSKINLFESFGRRKNSQDAPERKHLPVSNNHYSPYYNTTSTTIPNYSNNLDNPVAMNELLSKFATTRQGTTNALEDSKESLSARFRNLILNKARNASASTSATTNGLRPVTGEFKYDFKPSTMKPQAKAYNENVITRANGTWNRSTKNLINDYTSSSASPAAAPTFSNYSNNSSCNNNGESNDKEHTPANATSSVNSPRSYYPRTEFTARYKHLLDSN